MKAGHVLCCNWCHNTRHNLTHNHVCIQQNFFLCKCYSECHILGNVLSRAMPNVIVLKTIMASGIKLSVIMLSVILLCLILLSIILLDIITEQ
jgi:hypothetical protein